MTNTDNHLLTPRQLEILRKIFALYAEQIDCVGLFGSRATGQAKPYSDIDLVIMDH